MFDILLQYPWTDYKPCLIILFLQLGLGIPDLSNLGIPGLNLPQDEDDATLEDELAALMGEDDEDAGSRRQPRAKVSPSKQKGT